MGRVECNLFIVLSVCLSWCVGDDVHLQTPAVGKKGTKCYDAFKRPQRCIPGFENAAYGADITSTNTCGEKAPIEFCVQTNPSESRRVCQMCRAGDHSSKYLTDIHSSENQTWWQSETMYEGIQFPNQVNLTLSFGKSFDITYIRLDFYSPRPESFSIYKRLCEDCPWVPYQFFSFSCRETYGAPNSQFAPIGEETRPLCTSEYSDLIPLTGGNVLFSTLQGRPNAHNFATSDPLQEFVKATDIRISLDRLNTFGDEVFGDDRVLRTYFYAIADIAVGARCTCNGHAAECVDSTGLDGFRRRVCLCEHNTDGPDCNVCKPFYNDAPWKRATTQDANECKPCNCNGFSNRCIFDEKLYNQTGHGGYCLECTANRDGPNCERCRENYYQQEDGFCRPCECNEVGSRSLQCDRKGQCQCKPGVTGTKCDRCAENFYDFDMHGCKPCGCLREGSYDNTPRCDPVTGVCQCKENIEGKRCRQCKPGFFNLDENNEFGCTPCFCYGHSSVCMSAVGYSQVTIHSFFDRSSERWTAEDDEGRKIELTYNGRSQRVEVTAPERAAIYFIAPDRFLGDQRASYNKDLRFQLQLGDNGASASTADIILEGSGLYVSNTIFGASNTKPHTEPEEFKFRLHEHPDYKWHPRLSARAFMSILTNLTAIRIRATYTPQGIGMLDDFRLETAMRGAAGEPANWIEICECPNGYVGQFCESCAAGYRHSPALGGPFMQCEPCDCNKHASVCDSETGRCRCQDNTAGDNCEMCARGYYGNALVGTKFDCKPCGCPNNGPCIQMPDDKLVCLECPTGYTGSQCDLCSDGYFGDPRGLSGTVKACLPCVCNRNIDTNAVGNCNRTSGVCLKCIYNTFGESCEQCLPGYYGDALAIPKGDCKPCSCYPAGTQEAENGILSCDPLSGQCLCKPHVLGRNCNECEVGYFNIESEEGCQACNCDSTGSFNNTCDPHSGQCFCRPGVTGLRCDKCEEYKYGFSREGCLSCDCDIIGSSGLQCDHTGQCPCRTNVEGRKCDRCKENKYDRQQGCIDCPPSYNLVQDAIHEHQSKLFNLQEVLDGIKNNPTVIDGSEFDKNLQLVQARVDELHRKAKEGAGNGEVTLTEHIEEIKSRLAIIDDLLNNVTKMGELVKENVQVAGTNITEADQLTYEAKQLLNYALEHLSIQGKEALDRAIQKSKEFGHQNAEMENISREARKRADALEEEAKQIQELAKQAENVSQLAYKTAKNAIDKQQDTSDNLASLRSVITATKDKFDATQGLTKDAKARAQDVHQEALNILNEVEAITIPSVNTKQLEKEAIWKDEEAQNLLKQLDDLEAENNETVKNALDLIDESSILYSNADTQQQTIEGLLADADEAYSTAEKAVKKGNDTWQQAQKTYELLSQFDNEVNQHKQAAKEALAEVEALRTQIIEQEQKTREANLTLDQVFTNAQNAKIIAEDAKTKYAEEASKQTELIQEATDSLRLLAEKYREEANDFAQRVEQTGSDLKKLEDQAKNDRELIVEVKQKVGQAGKYSSEASAQVQKAMVDVDDIISILNNLPGVTSEDLDQLEAKLERAENELLKADLDKRIQNVRNDKQTQTILIDNYEKTVAALQQEVAIIKDISDSLPTNCFKRTKLEP